MDALAHPYLDEGRLRYHSCMCKCCHNLPTGRQYTTDFEPFCNQPFTYTFEDELTSIHKVKGTVSKPFMVQTQKHLFFSQILDGALCRAFKVQREFVSPLQITHLPPVWDLLLPLAYTPDRRDHWLLVSLPKDVGEIEPLSPRLTVRCSTARPPLPTPLLISYNNIFRMIPQEPKWCSASTCLLPDLPVCQIHKYLLYFHCKNRQI